MVKAIIFDVNGTFVDFVDLHALAWQEAFPEFGHDVTFEQAGSQIGKGGDKLVPVFLSASEQAHHGEALTEWRGNRCKSAYLSKIRPFSCVPDPFRYARENGLKMSVASSAKNAELDIYLEIAALHEFVNISIPSEGAQQSKPAPDIFETTLNLLNLQGHDAIAIGNSPYDAQAAGKANIQAIGFLSGGFNEVDLSKAGCIAVYPGPSSLFACFGNSPLV